MISKTTIALILFLVGCLTPLNVMAQNSSQKEEGASQAMRDLRLKALQTKPEDLQLSEPKSKSQAYGVMMDMCFSEGCATLVTYSTGDASLYTSKGGGIIGGGGHEKVHAAALRFNKVAERFVKGAEKSVDLSFPGAGRMKFYILTWEGTYIWYMEESDINNNDFYLMPLFLAANDVLTELRTMVEQTEKKDK